MRSKGNAPTAAQKRWYAWVSSQGCIISGGDCELHHVAGSSAKKNKIKIGCWFILPLSYWHHRDYSNMSNVDQWKKRFEAIHGTQKELFDTLVNNYMDQHNGEMPFDAETYQAIMEY